MIDQVSDLIELDLKVPVISTTKLRAAAPVFVPFQAQSESNNQSKVIPASGGTINQAESSFSTITTEPLSDDVLIINSKIRSSDEPPVLDLEFRGRRTSQDGPEKVVRKGLFNSSLSIRNPSFQEVFGTEVDGVRDKIDKLDEAGHDFAPKGTTPKGTAEAVLGSSSRIVNFSQSDLYRSNPPVQDIQVQKSTQSNDYFRKPLSFFHGIRYKPKEDDLVLNRSRVMIFNIPFGTPTTAILSKLRGGTIVSYQILNTKFAYNTASATVRFSSYTEAMRCTDHAATNPIILYGGAPLSIQLVPTPSYPLPPEIYRNIFEHGHTRCLRICDFHRRVPARIRRPFMDPQYIEYQAKNDCGDWFVRFTSVERATALWEELDHLRIHKAVGGGGFMPDPCDTEDSFASASTGTGTGAGAGATAAAGLQRRKVGDIKVIELGALRWSD